MSKRKRDKEQVIMNMAEFNAAVKAWGGSKAELARLCGKSDSYWSGVKKPDGVNPTVSLTALRNAASIMRASYEQLIVKAPETPKSMAEPTAKETPESGPDFFRCMHEVIDYVKDEMTLRKLYGGLDYRTAVEHGAAVLYKDAKKDESQSHIEYLTADCPGLAVITTNGFKGGDGSHGGYITAHIEMKNGGFCVTPDGSTGVYITARGDWEMIVFVNLLKYIVKEFEAAILRNIE